MVAVWWCYKCLIYQAISEKNEFYEEIQIAPFSLFIAWFNSFRRQSSRKLNFFFLYLWLWSRICKTLIACSLTYCSPFVWRFRTLIIRWHIWGCVDLHRFVRCLLLRAVWYGQQCSCFVAGTVCCSLQRYKAKQWRGILLIPRLAHPSQSDDPHASKASFPIPFVQQKINIVRIKQVFAGMARH